MRKNISFNPFLSGRVPPQLWDAVNDNAKNTNRTRTQVMIAAVTQYLNLPTPDVFDPHLKNAEIEEKILVIKEQLEVKHQKLENQLEQLVEQNKQLSDRCDDLAKRLSDVESTKPKPSTASKNLFPVDGIWDKHYNNGKTAK
jgi:regulator of replication initiation timing